MPETERRVLVVRWWERSRKEMGKSTEIGELRSRTRIAVMMGRSRNKWRIGSGKGPRAGIRHGADTGGVSNSKDSMNRKDKGDLEKVEVVEAPPRSRSDQVCSWAMITGHSRRYHREIARVPSSMSKCAQPAVVLFSLFCLAYFPALDKLQRHGGVRTDSWAVQVRATASEE